MKISNSCIATSCDSNYFPALLAFLRSSERTNPHIPKVVFDGGLSRQQAKKARKYAEVIRKEPFIKIEGKGKFSYIGNTTLLKFETASLDFEKVLYIDVDAVVLDKVDELFSFPEGTVGVVKEVNMIKSMFRVKHRKMLACAIDIEWDAPGFNAGLFALRPQEWKSLKAETMGLIERFGKDVFSKTKDQQLLNIIFYGKTYDFPGEYNFSPFYDTGKCSPAIIHYLAEYKPWRFDYPEGYNYRQFRDNLSFFEYPPIALVDVSRRLRKLKGSILKMMFPEKERSEWLIGPRLSNNREIREEENVQTIS